MVQVQQHGLAVYLSLLFIPVLCVFVLFNTAHIIRILCKYRTKSWDKPVSVGWSGIVKLTFMGSFRREKIKGTNEKFYILFGYFVSPKFVRNIAMLCLSLWQSLIVSFWITFLVETSCSCEFGLDCFDNRFNYIDDCGSFNFTHNSAQCYTFSLDFIAGSGTAGGLLAIALSVIYGQLSMQMWLKKKMDRSSNEKKKKKYKILSALSVFVPLSVEILFLALSLANLLYSVLYRQSLDSLPKDVLAFFYLFPLMQFTTLSLCRKPGLMSGEEVENDEEMMMNDDDHYISWEEEVDTFHNRQLKTRVKRYTAF